MSWIDKGLEYIGLINPDKGDAKPIDEIVKKRSKKLTPVSRGTSGPDTQAVSYSFKEDLTLIEPGYQYDVIPVIRKLSINNQSVSQALSNIVNLANTGVRLNFDSSVSLEKATEMRQEIESAVQNWHYGVADLNGLANKLFSQAMIAGAVCAEIIPRLDFKGVKRFFMPLPETIRFVYNKRTITYEPYQIQKGISADLVGPLPGYRKLNPNSFKYFAINGDTEMPYGNPPYLPSIPPLEDQKIMLENIKFIIKQMGVMGFLEIMVEGPEIRDFENDEQYAAAQEAYLLRVANNLLSSMRDGIVVGLKDEHEFNFHQSTKNAGGVNDLFMQNELLVSSGLKQDPSLAGKGGGGAETFVTVVFTKLLSELKNVQAPVSSILEHLCTLHLRLKGYTFVKLTPVFQPSTVQDDLKMQQSQEIKIRNKRQLRMDGIITQNQYADEVGYDKPAAQEPVVPFAPQKSSGDPNIDAEKKAVREKEKDSSDRKVRSKNRPQEKTTR